MDEKTIKEKISIAKKSVENESEPYKTEAFKIILSSLISETPIKPKPKSQSKSRKRTTNSLPIILEQKNEMGQLAKKCGISPDELSEVITIKNNVIQIIKRPELQENEKQVLFSLCILTCYKILYEIEWVPTITIRKCLDESGVGDMGHSSTNIKKSPLILDRGDLKGMEFKITGKGIDKAFEIIKKLSKDEPITES